MSGPLFDFLFDFVLFSALLAWMIWGWVSWKKFRLARPEVKGYFSVVGFSLASLVAITQIVMGTYAMAIGGFPFFDPTLLKIYSFCFFTAILAMVCSLVACIAEKSPLNWKAGVLSLFLWLLVIAQMMGE